MVSAAFVRVLGLAGALVSANGSLADAAAAGTTGPPPATQPPPRPDASKLTLKERSGGKAGDEQRVDDCKVPFDQRGDHRRPAGCAKR
jgi:hypothetical protein